jgi:hypothetical protein
MLFWRTVSHIELTLSLAEMTALLMGSNTNVHYPPSWWVLRRKIRLAPGLLHPFARYPAVTAWVHFDGVLPNPRPDPLTI